MRDYKEIPLWKDVTPEEWGDWKWQVKNRITDVDTLKQVINLTPKKKKGLKNAQGFPHGSYTVLCFINGSMIPTVRSGSRASQQLTKCAKVNGICWTL